MSQDAQLMLKPEDEQNNVSEKKQKKSNPVILIICIVLVLITAALVYLMAISSPESSAKLRDIFVVVYALETVVIAVALVVLICQVAQLINLTKNEVSPILKTTRETVNNVKGTVAFLGNNLVEPTIKANSTAAGVSKVVTTIASLFKK